MAHILITRPLKQASKTAKALTQLGHTCLVEPMLTIENVPSPLPDGPFEGVVATSANALPALASVWTVEERDKIPLLVTGAATAAAARELGFSNTQHVAGSATDLIDNVPAWTAANHMGPGAKLLYPSADILAHNVAEILSINAMRCLRWIVYRAVPARNLSATANSALAGGEIDCVFLYSRRTAQTFVQLMQQDNLSLTNFRTCVLSKDILDSLPEEMKDRATSAAQPNEEEMLRLIVP